MTSFPLRIPVVPIRQSIGTFYVGMMRYQDALEISSTDQRRFDEGRDDFIGIQRPLKKSRVSEIAEYLRGDDAAFPTSVVFAIESSCASIEYSVDREFSYLILEPTEFVKSDEIARIIDGQHRLEGLRRASLDSFEIACAFFVGADLPDQAVIFATVNLTQSKINRSQAYDLLSFASDRSPERVLHEIVVALDRNSNSPFCGMIKRLGVATPERDGETITQAAFFDGLLGYLSHDPVADRNAARKNKPWPEVPDRHQSNVIFRRLFTSKRDDDLYGNIARYFAAVRDRWPAAWEASRENESVLVKTTGFLALCKLLECVYLSQNDDVLHRDYCLALLKRSSLKDSEITSDEFPSGSVGQRKFYIRLLEELEIHSAATAE